MKSKKGYQDTLEYNFKLLKKYGYELVKTIMTELGNKEQLLKK